MAIPPAYAPQRYASPTMRHASPSSLSPSHFTRHQANHFRRKARQAFRGKAEQDEEEITPKKPFMDNLLGMSFEEVPFSAANPPDDASIFRTQSVASVATSASLDSSMTGQSAVTGDSARRSSFAPSMCTSSSSFVITPLATPASSRAPSMIQTDSSMESSLPSPIEGYAQEIPDTPAVKGSWVPNFGKMAKAVVHHGMNMSPFGEKKSRKTSGAVKIAPAATDAVYMPEVHVPQPTLEELQRLDEEAAMDRRREWAFEQQQRVQECARLCSQWPQSGYNQMKWGPYGSKHFYEPQSYCNPQHVASVMQRQAELERKLCEESALFFSCRRTSADSSSSSSPTVGSARSSENLSADLSAAMSDSLISKEASPLERVMSGKRSLSDLKSLSMDVDQDPVAPTTRPSRAQSICGFKRPLTSTPATEEEDKRRRVDEAMVVEEAVETAVIQPAKPFSPPVLGGRQLSASTPNLNANADAPAMFGHVIKTSDTHPIIISPFFPEELLKIISQNVTAPQQYGVVPAPASAVLVSSVDVPSLLLSFIPPQIQGQAPMIPPPMLAPSPSPSRVEIGNLLLSSCPGKRLRMEGPVKGRGPVCRDLETDLRRIKNEGVGCLVCCLDDSELALLGVPWENYSAVAASIGLDVVRLPMPDGFTPVSLSLFDAQINLIATKYSLQGINVLVHCRGGVGRAGLTASAWAIKMGFVTPHPSLTLVAESAFSKLPPSELASRVNAPGLYLPSELEHQICMSMVERVIAMIRSRRGLKAIESFEQVQFLAAYVKWLRAGGRV